MFYVKNPSALNKPWILSKDGNISIPVEVAKHLKNYHVMAVEFLYHNYRKGMKGSILNQEPDMNLPLQLSSFFRALVEGPAIVLVVCTRQSLCFWHYHLTNHANFNVIQVTTENSEDSYDKNDKKLALLVTHDCLKLCENLHEHEFFSVVIEDLDQIAIKRIVKRLDGKFNVGLTCRSFYTNPDQKLQWNMMNWANPGCVGKLNEFYAIDNKNFERFEDNYRHWWLRLTWQFCESFEKPNPEDLQTYEQIVSEWASANSLSFTPRSKKKTRKRKLPTAEIHESPNLPTTDEVISDSCSSEGTIINEVPIDKYVKLPSMDENPIVTSIIKNFEISPEPILSKSYYDLPYTQTQPNCSKFRGDNSVIFSFLGGDEERPSTSKSDSEQFILNLIDKNDEKQDIDDVLKKADAVLQN